MATGDTTAAYIPSFDVELNEARDTLDKTFPKDGGRTHRYSKGLMVLVQNCISEIGELCRVKSVI